MKVVALVSGGKDSLFSAMHCVAQSHELIALANLCPQVESASDELDSFMYQTVGWDVVPAIAACMDLPLVRRRIAGRPLQSTANVYHEGKVANDSDTFDEVEDLYALLLDVKRQFPHVEAVSAGAILSNYQRCRVENVCSRLELIPMAYLWRYNQQRLLESMFRCQLEAVVVKVAAMGLGAKDLGRPLQDLFPKLLELHERYDVHVAGEGGEYETLVLDCPIFKRKRIVLNGWEQAVHSDDGINQVVFLHKMRFHLEEKSEDTNDDGWMKFLQEEGKKLVADVEDIHANVQVAELPDNSSPGNFVKPSLSIHHAGSLLAISSLTCNDATSDVTAQAESIFSTLSHIIAAESDRCSSSLTFANIAMAHVYLGDMADFAAVNTVYARFFGRNHPAARACVCLPTLASSGCKVMVSVVATTNCSAMGERMHVQGLSHWAPANIGPYSQAVRLLASTDPDGISTFGRVYIAGQIGMIPATLAVAGMVAGELELSIDHVLSIANALLRQDVSPRVLHPCVDDESCDERQTIATESIEGVLATFDWTCAEVDEGATHSPAYPHPSPALFTICYLSRSAYVDPALAVIRRTLHGYRVPTLYATVAHLPKSANVEWEMQLWDPTNFMHLARLNKECDNDGLLMVGGRFTFIEDLVHISSDDGENSCKPQEWIRKELLTYTPTVNGTSLETRPLSACFALSTYSVSGVHRLLDMVSKYRDAILDVRMFYRGDVNGLSEAVCGSDLPIQLLPVCELALEGSDSVALAAMVQFR